jgi:putative glutamine amidotransferase
MQPFSRRPYEDAMSQPLIGITTHASDAEHRDALDRLSRQIVHAVEAAGGLPVLLPPNLGEAALRGLFERIDGLLLSGGGDIDPARYGASHTPAVGGVDAARDRAELLLAGWALTEQKPFFGICRGLQILNIACGGSLYRDIAEYPGAQRHTFYPDFPFDRLSHPIEIAPGSQLARIVGRTTLDINSLHHQACRAVAAGLRAVARSPDGMVEAIEVEEHPFGLAVQWHPEALPGLPEMRALFGALVAASAQSSVAAAPDLAVL